MPWDLIEEVGGEEVLQKLMRTFYDRLFEDLMIGFFFAGKDKEALVASQIDYVYANLGNRAGDYSGLPIRKAHHDMAILSGHFDRRHTILKEVLQEFEVPILVQEAWIALDLKMRPMVIRQGKEIWEKKSTPREKD